MFIEILGLSGVAYFATILMVFFLVFEIFLPSFGLFSIVSGLLAIGLLASHTFSFTILGIVIGASVLIYLGIAWGRSFPAFVFAVCILWIGFLVTFEYSWSVGSVLRLVGFLFLILAATFGFFSAIRKVISLHNDVKGYFNYDNQEVVISSIETAESVSHLHHNIEYPYAYKVFLRGSYWNALSHELFSLGEKAVVKNLSHDDLILEIAKADIKG